MSNVKKVTWLSFWAAVAVWSGAWAQDIGSTYAANCANCHGLDGRGNTALGRALKVRDLRSPEVQKLSEAELLAILSKGTARGKMPGFEKKLGTEAVHKLATYVQQIQLQPVPVPQIKKAAESEASSEAEDVKGVYSAKCSHCHGADGSGNTILGRNLKLLDMRSPEAQKFSDNEIVAIVANGMDRGRMPGFQKKLGADMVEQLASYVRGLAGNSPIVPTKKAISLEAASKAVPSESANSAVRVDEKPIPIVHPEKQIQKQKKQPAELHRVSPFAKLSSVGLAQRKGGSQTELVDLNSASKETLMTLPGINEADAEGIIAGRPYKSSLQFKTRRIVAPETYARIAGRVVANQTRPPTRRMSEASGHTQ